MTDVDPEYRKAPTAELADHLPGLEAEGRQLVDDTQDDFFKEAGDRLADVSSHISAGGWRQRWHQAGVRGSRRLPACLAAGGQVGWAGWACDATVLLGVRWGGGGEVAPGCMCVCGGGGRTSGGPNTTSVSFFCPPAHQHTAQTAAACCLRPGLPLASVTPPHRLPPPPRQAPPRTA